MVTDMKPGQTVRVTISKSINRDSARKTLERLFMCDPAQRKPIQARSDKFVDQPKRRGGCIWTKRPNKIHLPLNKGDAATIKATAQAMRDLGSVAAFVQVATA